MSDPRPQAEPSPAAPKSRGTRVTALLCTAFAAFMVAAAFAAVPLYDLFCKATGFDGTPLVGSAPASTVLDRKVTIRFDGNVAPGLDWRFSPERPSIDAKIGETQTVFFKARNSGSAPSTGIAAFNVQPGYISAYFVKLQCFCFTEQTLDPGEAHDLPVVFYIDPAIANDPNLADLSEITLSYTYFPAPKPAAPVATSSAAVPKPKS